MAATTPFNLAPHELPPFADGELQGFADAVFEVNWKGKIQVVVARSIATIGRRDYCVLFRVGDESTSRIVAHPRKMPRKFYSSDESTDVASIVTQALRCGYWGRAFRVDTRELGGAGICWLYLDADRTSGYWEGIFGIKGRAHFRVEPDVCSFAESLADPHSDTRFALSWMQLRYDVQKQLSTAFTRGNLDELRQVITAIARYDDSAQRHHCLSYRNQFFYIGLGFCITPPISESLQKWDFYIQKHFGICVPEEFAGHSCVLFMPPQIYVERVPLSQHDRLEAMLFLLDWAKDKMPVDELLQLFPTL